MMLQSDGSIVVGGLRRIQYLESRQTDFALARFESILPPDFAIALEQSSIDAARKQSVRIPINISRIRGFAGEVTVTAPDVKALKMKFTQSSISTTEGTVIFKLKVKKGTKGSHQLTFHGQDESGRLRQITLTLNVR
jgi:hypothetical protein